MTLKQIFILLIIALSVGCTPKQPLEEIPLQEIDWPQETAESVHARITTSAQKIDILSAFFSLSMNPPPKKMMSSMSGVITIDNRSSMPKIRIQAFHLFGSTLFDMVNTDTIKIYIPRKNTMYIGVNNGKNSHQKGPQTIFANMMLEPASLILQEDTPLEIQKDTVKLYLVNGWISLDKQSGLIIARHKDDLDITYSAYKKLGSHPPIPTQINLKTRDDSYVAKCTLSQLSIPETLPETFFDLNEYRPKTIKELEDLP